MHAQLTHLLEVEQSEPSMLSQMEGAQGIPVCVRFALGINLHRLPRCEDDSIVSSDRTIGHPKGWGMTGIPLVRCESNILNKNMKMKLQVRNRSGDVRKRSEIHPHAQR